MKIITFLNRNQRPRLGLFIEEKILDLEELAPRLNLTIPSDILEFLRGGEEMMARAQKVEEAFLQGGVPSSHPLAEVRLLSPVPHPPSCRDGYAFRNHVVAGRKNRGLEMIPEFDQFPVFYFTNHQAIFGPDRIPVQEDHLQNLDFELEVAVVIGKGGKNISAEDADSHIAGYTIMNDFSARHLQMEEMKLNLGPAKGKDFATALGPYLVTRDELESRKTDTPAGHKGEKYDLQMRAFHQGKAISHGNLQDMSFTFAEMIERASYGVEIFPGEVMGSGTVGTGCYLELNGTWHREAQEKGESFESIWLQDGDTIELEVEGLGRLSNKIVKESDYSILDKKKNKDKSHD